MHYCDKIDISDDEKIHVEIICRNTTNTLSIHVKFLQPFENAYTLISFLTDLGIFLRLNYYTDSVF